MQSLGVKRLTLMINLLTLIKVWTFKVKARLQLLGASRKRKISKMAATTTFQT